MNVWPLRFRELQEERFLFSDDAGGFFRGNEEFLDRYARGELTEADWAFLRQSGHAFERETDLSYTSFAYRWSARQAVSSTMAYAILVPTLRCNLACGYCQVSRAPEGAAGFDWTEETLSRVITFLGGLDTPEIKIEFQGGEPLLRLDLLERVRDFCRERFSASQFIVCTNLQAVDETAWRFVEARDTFVSTSFDGDFATHLRQRTRTTAATASFFANLDQAVARLGPGKVSALPTIDPERPPTIEALVEGFEKRGIRSIYLRPINHQGFARRGRSPDQALDRWNAFHREFIEWLIDRNHRSDNVIEEYYFSQCIRRVLRAGSNEHVDLRNPNLMGRDHIVVDYDGLLYPTDEARMQSRIGRIDLSIGNVRSGLDPEKISLLNAASFNNFDPDCIHCAFQPYCGVDLIDDLSRYGRADRPRHETWFCRRHISLFDHVFELLYRQDDATQFSLSRWAGLGGWPGGIVREHS